MTGPSVPEQQPEQLVEGLITLGGHRRMLWSWPLVAAAVALAVTLVLPKGYTAVTRILPPQQGQGAAALLGQLGGLGSLAGALGGGLGLKNPSDLYLGMLRSDTVADALIQRFALKELYDEETMDEARKELRKRSSFTSDKAGIITVSVEGPDPRKAADMANAYVEELHKLTSTLAVTDAAQRRVFFERQLQMTKDKLADAEVKLRQAIESGGLVSVDAQSRAAVETVARLRATISAKEIQLGSMRAYATEGNPDRVRVEQELASMRRELAKLESGTSGGLKEEPTVEGAPPASGGVGNIRLLREVKYHEVMFELMAKQYELSRVEESKESPLIQVMDRAAPPERKSSPKRGLIITLTVAASLLLTVLAAFAKEERERIRRDPVRSARLAVLRDAWLRRGASK